MIHTLNSRLEGGTLSFLIEEGKKLFLDLGTYGGMRKTESLLSFIQNQLGLIWNVSEHASYSSFPPDSRQGLENKFFFVK